MDIAGGMRELVRPKTFEELGDILRGSRAVLVDGYGNRKWALPTTLRLQAELANVDWSLIDVPYQLPTEQVAIALEFYERKRASVVAQLEARKLPENTKRIRITGFRDRRTVIDEATFGGGHSLYIAWTNLGKVHRRLPIPDLDRWRTLSRTLGVTMYYAIGYDLPLPGSEMGTWRDWIVAMTVMIGNGSILEVDGRDALPWIGTRGTMGIILSVTLKTIWKTELPTFRLFGSGNASRNPISIQRTRPDDFLSAVNSAWDRLLLADPTTSTLWIDGPDRVAERFDGDQLWTQVETPQLEIQDAAQIRQLREWKAEYDPEHKLNPGDLGIF